VITLVFWFPGWGMHAHAAQQPNVVIIVADDVGYGDLSSYGGKVSTPALDRLAREGLKFTDFHATPFCTPTRASLLTGRYSQRMPGLEWPLDVDSTEGIPAAEVTLAEMLAPEYPGRGIVGKWHLGRQPYFNPVNNGFTSFYGMLKGWGDYLTHKDRSGLVDWWNGLVHLTKIEYSTAAIIREALKKINYNTKQNQPFFLYVPYQAVHIPYMPPVIRPVRTIRRTTGQLFRPWIKVSDRSWDGSGRYRGRRSYSFSATTAVTIVTTGQPTTDLCEVARAVYTRAVYGYRR
jgi:arylsulfatase A-like enzyme